MRSPELVIAIAAIAVVLAAALAATRRPRQLSASPTVSVGAIAEEPGADRTRRLVDVSALDVPRLTFADVAGLDDAIAELREVQEYLADPDRFRRLGAELPRGILLCGEPGNGKTLLARALAGETGVPFYSVSAAGFVEQYVGLGAARIRAAFDEVRAGPVPAIVFIDELDAIGGRRNGGSAGDREFDHTLNQLLVELDGFASLSGVLIVGATNREELLDPALTRPGRFDRKVYIERPDLRGRADILRLHGRGRPISRQVDWDAVAAHTTGLSGAELASVVNDAALLAARRHRERVAVADVDEAIARAARGTRKSRVIGDEEKCLLAQHEAGHALLALLVKDVAVPSRVSIITGSSAHGRSPWSLAPEQENLTRRHLMAQLIVLLGGRAAELNVFGEPSTRAEDDLDAAATIARRMIERWAMTGRYELAGADPDAVTRARTGAASEAEVGKVLRQAEGAARQILADHAAALAAVARGLVVDETISIADVAVLAGLDPSMVAPRSTPAPLATVARLRR
ncbi:MAG: AAA family ATPase [Actinomycetota bacterium]|nr:AAA family ATPase [Acidimicrobiia bacterium]MDQ3294940.1 AAA family ATPase [Actinomycetota bacterium]